MGFLNTFFRRLAELARAAFPRRRSKTSRRERGDAGEAFAAKFLRREGAKILLRNWRHGRDEIDIVALDGACLVFVEVKTRSEDDPHGGYAAVDARKRNAQKRAARAYLNSLRERPPAHRFDVVEVFVRETDGSMRAVHHRAVPFSRRYSN